MFLQTILTLFFVGIKRFSERNFIIDIHEKKTKTVFFLIGNEIRYPLIGKIGK
jgi:hypothetical protein